LTIAATNVTPPVLLAGPILRRSEPDKVCIWIAMSKPATVRAEIFRLADFNKDLNAAEKQLEPVGVGIAEPLKLGEQLYVTLVIAKPVQGPKSRAEDLPEILFPTDELLAYDIEILNKGSAKGCRLKDLGLLSGKKSIVYQGQHPTDDNNDAISLPTFFLRGKSSSNPLNILYGSCRKLHGEGEDSLIAGDNLISKSTNDLSIRPAALYLIGDQIYADDVAGPLIKHLTSFGNELIGYEEQIRGIHNKLTDLQIGERQRLVEKHAKFSSDRADNHLLSFGEFAAMYLVAWNGENWPKSYPPIASIPHKAHLLYLKQQIRLEQALKAMPAVRRLLANIPTYMIFDDHEVTDDWNIDGEWYDNVNASDCGKQIVTNALTAYWAFQAWGNDPDLYGHDFLDNIIGYMKRKSENSRVDGDGNDDDGYDNELIMVFENFMWNFHGWTFSIPTNPLTIFLDCRTQRHFGTQKGAAPWLLNEAGLASALHTAKKAGYNIGDPIIIVSPTPVFGFELAEGVQEFLASVSGIYRWDLEAWASNETGFIRFVSFLVDSLHPKYCLLMSGDVHYSFTMAAIFTLLKAQEQKSPQERTTSLSTPMIQLTSSALKSTGLVNRLLIEKFLGSIHELLPSSDQTIRAGKIVIHEGENHNENTVLFESKRHVNLPQRDKTPGLCKEFAARALLLPNYEDIQTIIRSFYSMKQPLPDWIEFRNLVDAEGSGSSPILSGNNIGLVKFDDRSHTLVHKLLVCQRDEIKTREAKLIIELMPSSHQQF
jgi:hypothetical protein